MRLTVRPTVHSLEDRATPATLYVDPALAGLTGSQTFDAGQPDARTVFVGPGGDGFASLAEAIGVAGDPSHPGGDTIQLAVATHKLDNSAGPVVLDATNPLTIAGPAGPGFTGPAVIVPTTDTADGTTAVLQADGAGALLNLSNLTFDGQSKAATPLNVGRGVLFSNGSTGVVNTVTFQNLSFPATSDGYELSVKTGSTVNVQNGTFTGYGFSGISTTDANLTVQKSTFTGSGSPTATVYGIEVGLVTPGVESHTIINGSTFTDNLGQDGDISSAGVFVFTATNNSPVVQVYGNNFTNNQVGVLVDSDATSGVDSSGVQVFANNFAGGVQPAISAPTSTAEAVQAPNNNYGGAAPVPDAPNGITGSVGTSNLFLTTPAPQTVADTPAAYIAGTGINAYVVTVQRVSLPDTAFQVPYNQTRAATGVGPYTYAVTAGTLPTGLTLNGTTGAITGTSSTTGTSFFTITATDSTGVQGSQSFAITVFPAPSLTPATLPGGSTGVDYNQTLKGIGSPGPFQYVVSLRSLPPGLSLDPTTGVISGTPTATGTFPFTVTVTDTNTGGVGSQVYSIAVAAAPVVGPATLPDGTVGTAYSQTLTTSVTPGPFTYAVTTGSLPAGLTLDAATGVISGTPTAAATSTFTITSTDTGTGQTGSRSYTVVINPVIVPVNPTLSPASLPGATVGTAYNQTLTAAGTPGPYLYSVSGTGSLPAGLSLNPTTGAITGTPTAAGTSSFSVTATDLTTGGSVTQPYSIVVNPSVTPLNPVVTPTTLPVPTVGTAYNQTISATGTPGPFTFAVTAGSLPAGLSLNPTTGAITGTPTTAGPAAFTISATDTGTGTVGSQAYTLTVGSKTLTTPFAAGQDVGGGVVNVYGANNALLFSVTPFAGFTGGVRTAVADVNGDGVADLIVGTGPGTASQIKVYDGAGTHAVLFTATPFESSFTGGVYVAAGDIDGDGKAEIVVTPDQSGGPRVLVYKGGTFAQEASFFAFTDDPNFRGGARAAVADVNGDGFGDLIVSAGFGGGPRVAVYSGKSVESGAAPTKLFNDFFAFEDTLRNGVYLAGGDVNGDGFADIIAGGGPGGGPRVEVIDGAKAIAAGGINLTADPGLLTANFFAGDSANRGGIRVAAKQFDGDQYADLVVGSGQGAGSQVTGYLGSNLRTGNSSQAFQFDAFPGFTGGVFVG